MTVLNQVQKLINEDEVPLYLVDQVSEMVNELADLKAEIIKAELKFNSARSAAQKLDTLSHWKRLDQNQTDLAIDLAEMLNLPE
jgi:hypothetical protein